MAGGFADKKALVLFSGGQDSTTCLAWALKNFKEVETVGFDYGQRHTAEITCRKHILETIEDVLPYAKGRLGQDHMIDMKVLGQISECSLTREIEIEFEKDGVPNSFVPARNLLFFTFASAIAYRRGGSVLVGGMCETDYSGYADCRDNTLKSLQVSLSLGLDRQIVIETPLMWLTKAETWQLGHDLGGCSVETLLWSLYALRRTPAIWVTTTCSMNGAMDAASARPVSYVRTAGKSGSKIGNTLNDEFGF